MIPFSHLRLVVDEDDLAVLRRQNFELGIGHRRVLLERIVGRGRVLPRTI
jgi:hypothetical protein